LDLNGTTQINTCRMQKRRAEKAPYSGLYKSLANGFYANEVKEFGDDLAF